MENPEKMGITRSEADANRELFSDAEVAAKAAIAGVGGDADERIVGLVAEHIRPLIEADEPTEKISEEARRKARALLG